MDYAALQTELLNDPQGLGYAAHISSGNHLVLAQLLNTEDISVYSWVTRDNFLIWTASSIRAKIEDTANDSQDSLRSSALVLQAICNGSTEGIDFSKAQNIALLTAWKTAGKITEQEETELLNLSIKLVSRSYQLFQTHVSIVDIAIALEQ